MPRAKGSKNVPGGVNQRDVTWASVQIARARKYGVQYERVERQEVYKRAGEVCQRCAIETDLESGEIVHIIPVSWNGPHFYSNCCFLCQTCAKGVKGRGGKYIDPRDLHIRLPEYPEELESMFGVGVWKAWWTPDPKMPKRPGTGVTPEVRQILAEWEQMRAYMMRSMSPEDAAEAAKPLLPPMTREDAITRGQDLRLARDEELSTRKRVDEILSDLPEESIPTYKGKIAHDLTLEEQYQGRILIRGNIAKKYLPREWAAMARSGELQEYFGEAWDTLGLSSEEAAEISRINQKLESLAPEQVSTDEGNDEEVDTDDLSKLFPHLFARADPVDDDPDEAPRVL